MKWRLHIERLDLRGLDITAAQAVRLQAALESELSMLMQHGLPGRTRPSPVALGALPAVDLGPGTAAEPVRLGTDLARSLHAAVGSWTL